MWFNTCSISSRLPEINQSHPSGLLERWGLLKMGGHRNKAVFVTQCLCCLCFHSYIFIFIKKWPVCTLYFSVHAKKLRYFTSLKNIKYWIFPTCHESSTWLEMCVTLSSDGDLTNDKPWMWWCPNKPKYANLCKVCVLLMAYMCSTVLTRMFVDSSYVKKYYQTLHSSASVLFVFQQTFGLQSTAVNEVVKKSMSPILFIHEKQIFWSYVQKTFFPQNVLICLMNPWSQTHF